ncbi:MAG: 30S ribosome-binding factor RbfA [Planctomycetales bacterium]|nr:30S ribosome-binding factor RbfA [Planctomycetales bacterium]
MTSRRVLKVAEAIREVVGMAILTDLRDPRIQDVTVTFVEVSGDLRSAKVHVSVMGNEAKQKLSLKGLQNASGYLQQKVSDRVELRYTPRLQFVLDQGVKNSIEVARILREVLPDENEATGSATETDDSAFEDDSFDTDGQSDVDAPDDDDGTAST